MAEPKVTKELIEKAQKCETPEQLIELAKTEGFEVTKEQAEAFIAQTQDAELDSDALKSAAGGGCPRCWCNQISWDCPVRGDT